MESQKIAERLVAEWFATNLSDLKLLRANIATALDAAIAEKDAEMAVLREAHNAEADEFNAGFEAYRAGLPEDAPREDPHDVWLCGYAWAAYEDLKRELAVLREENERLRAELESGPDLER